MAHWDFTPHLKDASPAPAINPDIVTVYSTRFCPFAERVILVLLTKKIPFQVININLRNKPKWFLSQTAGKVPILMYKGKVITESLAVCDYLDQNWPQNPLHPQDERRKENNGSLVEAFGQCIRPLYVLFTLSVPTSLKEVFGDVVKVLQEVNSVLGIRGEVFLGGEKPGMADLMIWPWFERIAALHVHGDDFCVPPSLVNLNVWIRAMLEVPAVKEYGVNPEDMVKFRRGYYGEPRNADIQDMFSALRHSEAGPFGDNQVSQCLPTTIFNHHIY